MSYRKGMISDFPGGYYRQGNIGRSIFRLADGTLYFVDGYTIIFKSTDDGITWIQQDSANVPTGVAGNSGNACIDSAGNIHIAYKSNTPNAYSYVKFSHSSGTYSTSEVIETTATSTAAPITICIDGGNFPHVVFEKSWVIYYSNRVAGTWSLKEQVSATETEQSKFPNIIVRGTLVYAIWARGLLGSSSNITMRIKDGSWGSIESISLQLTRANPTCCIETSGIIHVFFNSGTNLIHSYGASGSFSDEIVYNNIPNSIGYSGISCGLTETSGIDLYITGAQDVTYYPVLWKKIGSAPWEMIILETTTWDMSDIFWSYYNYNHGNILRMVYFVQLVPGGLWDSYYYEYAATLPSTIFQGFQAIIWN